MNSWHTPPPELPPGTILDGRFELIRRLGWGSFGEVYDARQLVHGHPLRNVALKLFAADCVTAANVHEVFHDAIALIGLQEQLPTARVQAHLVQVFDMGMLSHPPRAFLAMRLVPGRETVLDVVRRHGSSGMPVMLSIEFLCQLLVPLAWMHSLPDPVIHGDLKPDNVLFSPDRQLVLTDFGLAAKLSEGGRAGAIAYQAPETLDGFPGLPPTDIYAVGLIWYEMLTGRHPFANVGEAERLANNWAGHHAAHRQARAWPIRPARGAGASSSNRIVPVSEINPNAADHPQIEALLARCLHSDPAARVPNAQTLLSALETYQREGHTPHPGTPNAAVGVAPPQPKPEQPTEQPQVRRLLADGEAYLARDDIPSAMQVLQQAAAVAPHMHATHVSLGRAALRAGRIDAAQAAYVQAKNCAQNHPDVLRLLADIYDARGDTAVAAGVRRRIQHTSP